MGYLAENGEAVDLKSELVQQACGKDFSPCHMPNQGLLFCVQSIFLRKLVMFFSIY